MAGLTKIHKIGIGVGIFCLAGAVVLSYWDNQKKAAADQKKAAAVEAQRQFAESIATLIRGEWNCVHNGDIRERYTLDQGKMSAQFADSTGKGNDVFVEGTYVPSGVTVTMQLVTYRIPGLERYGLAAPGPKQTHRKSIWTVTSITPEKMTGTATDADEDGSWGPSFDLSCQRIVRATTAITPPPEKVTVATNQEPASAKNEPRFEDQAKTFLQRWFQASSNATSAADIIGFYSSQVDYYGKGVVSKSYVESDKAAYFKRWPVRSSTISGNIRFSNGKTPNELVATFALSYRVANIAGQSKEGQVPVALTLIRDGDAIFISGEKN